MPVMNGQVLTAAQLTGLHPDRAGGSGGRDDGVIYLRSDGTTTVNAGTTINVTPVNHAPVARQAPSTVGRDAAVVNGGCHGDRCRRGRDVHFRCSTAPRLLA